MHATQIQSCLGARGHSRSACSKDAKASMIQSSLVLPKPPTASIAPLNAAPELCTKKALQYQWQNFGAEFLNYAPSRTVMPVPGKGDTVRRQSFWDRERLKIRESLARLVFNVMRPADGAASGDWRLSFV